jgi:hypothetical protein
MAFVVGLRHHDWHGDFGQRSAFATPGPDGFQGVKEDMADCPMNCMNINEQEHHNIKIWNI